MEKTIKNQILFGEIKFNIDYCFKSNSGIYVIRNKIDDRIYIGSTINFYKRYKDHVRKLQYGIHANSHLQNFSIKYGLSNLSFNMLYLCRGLCLKSVEQIYISKFNCCDNSYGFNIKPLAERRMINTYSEQEWFYIIKSIPKLIENLDIKATPNEIKTLPF
jgi:group I intron endonuclease